MSANLIIRRSKTTEYDHIADLWFNSWMSTGLGHTSSVTRDDLRLRFETEQNWELFVAVKRSQVVGMIALKRDESKLDQLFIDPQHQRQGIGRLLVNAAKKRLPKGMWLKVHCQNSPAIRFYQSQGFELDSERSIDRANSADVFFRWDSTT